MNTLEYAFENKANLLNMIGNILKNDELAEDAYQSGLIRLLNSKSKVESVKAFVYTTMRNESLRHLKKNRMVGANKLTHDFDFEIAHHEHPENILLQRNCNAEIHEILNSDLLSDKRKHTVNLIMNNDSNEYHRDIARQNGLHFESFKTNFRLARLELMEKLDFNHFYFPETSVINIESLDNE